MLYKLEEYWTIEWYFNKKKLSELSEAKDDWFDHIIKEVIDFDETWIKYWKRKKLWWQKSADVLTFKTDNELFFIEFKNFEKLIKYEPNPIIKINYIDFKTKVENSLDILYTIILEKKFRYENKDIERKNINKKFNFSIKFDENEKWKELEPQIKSLLALKIYWLQDIENNLKVNRIETKNIEAYL